MNKPLTCDRCQKAFRLPTGLAWHREHNCPLPVAAMGQENALAERIMALTEELELAQELHTASVEARGMHPHFGTEEADRMAEKRLERDYRGMKAVTSLTQVRKESAERVRRIKDELTELGKQLTALERRKRRAAA